MIKGVHSMFYSSKSGELRKFFKEKLGFKAIDIGQGWLIFDVPEADMGVHPANPKKGAASGLQDISFYCDDIKGTVKGLKKKGVKFKGEIEDHGDGLVTYMKVPGNFYIQLYEPRYRKQGTRNPPAQAPAGARRAGKKPRTRNNE